MKHYLFIPIIALLFLSGCTAQLSEEDRSFLMETKDAAQQAANDAYQSSNMAAEAAASAAESAEKASRAFLHSGIK